MSTTIQLKTSIEQSYRLLERINDNNQNIMQEAINILKNTQNSKQQQSFLFFHLAQNNDVFKIPSEYLINTAVELTLQDKSLTPLQGLAQATLFENNKLNVDTSTFKSLLTLFAQNYPITSQSLMNDEHFQQQISGLFTSPDVLYNTGIKKEDILEFFNIIEDNIDDYIAFCTMTNNSVEEEQKTPTLDFIQNNVFKQIINLAHIDYKFSPDDILCLLKNTQKNENNKNGINFILKNNHSAELNLNRKQILQAIGLNPHINESFDIALKHNEHEQLELTLADFKMLIDRMTDNIELNLINQTNKQGNTPLMQAITKGNEPLALYILEKNPELKIKNKLNYNVLDLAFMKNQNKVIEALDKKLNDNDDLKNKLNTHKLNKEKKVVPLFHK